MPRTTPSWPGIWFGEGRWAQHPLLVEWLNTRVRQQGLRRVDSPDAVVRTLLETVAFWAMHRHFDAWPQEVDDAAAESAVVDLMAYGLPGNGR